VQPTDVEVGQQLPLRKIGRLFARTTGRSVMTTNDPASFHKLYSTQKPRAVYYKKDFLDYLLMIALSALIIGLSYGFGHIVAIVGLALCLFTVVMFAMRHGIAFAVPIILRRPEEVLHTFAYKLQNLKPMYFVALGVLLAETMLVTATPNLPHHVELMRKVALYLFFIHLVSITIFRTVILIDHLAKKELVREVLIQTPWKRVIKEKTNITLEIVHAYCTGVLTHIIMIAPWYLVIIYAKFSVVFLPAVCLINIIVHVRWLKTVNAWFYRDHWLGHNSEFEFVFFHGTHHDAIPSGLIAVSENGFLEGFARHAIGWPLAFYNPIISFLIYMFEVKSDIELHQYIPGIFPRLSRKSMELFQHSTHHYGPLEPYGFAFRLDQPDIPKALKKKAYDWMPEEMKNAIKLDEDLTGFKWENPTFRRTLSLYDKYQK
jgi:hypothetical protein